MEKYKYEPQLMHYYSQMVSILQEQKRLLELANEEDTLQDAVQLTEQWAELAERIRIMEEQGQGVRRLSASLQGEVGRILQQMQLLHTEVTAKLGSIQQSMVHDMSNVKKQQTVVRGYGGLSYQDTTSLYFDEKN